MTFAFNSLRSALQRRARYNQTVRELRAMPWDVAHDLDIDKTRAEQIAARAVYGA